MLVVDGFRRANPDQGEAEDDQANARNRPAPVGWKGTGRHGHDVAWMRSAEEGYRAVRRYSAGVMPVARRNARVKLDCEENWQLKAISLSDGFPVAINAFAASSR